MADCQLYEAELRLFIPSRAYAEEHLGADVTFVGWIANSVRGMDDADDGRQATQDGRGMTTNEDGRRTMGEHGRRQTGDDERNVFVGRGRGGGGGFRAGN